MTTLSSAVISAGVRAGAFVRFYETISACLAATDSIGEGEIVRAGAHVCYIGAASGASDHDVTNAGGSKLYVQPTIDGLYDVRAFGAVESTANDAASTNRVIVQAALDNISARSGGTLVFPPSSSLSHAYPIGPAAGGHGLELPDNVDISGGHKVRSAIRFAGTFTDSMLKSAVRDDASVNTWVSPNIQSMRLIHTGDAVAMLDFCGMRNFMMRDVSLQGVSLTDDSIAMRFSDRPPGGSANKTCFFGLLDGVYNYGSSFGIWCDYEQNASNCNSHSMRNIYIQARQAFDFNSVNTAINLTISSGYASANNQVDSAFVVGGHVPPRTKIQQITPENYVAGNDDAFKNIYATGLSKFGALELTDELTVGGDTTLALNDSDPAVENRLYRDGSNNVKRSAG